MKELFKTFLLFIALGMVLSGTIIMDRQNPLQLNQPHRDTGIQSLIFRFMLPVTMEPGVNDFSAGGLSYGQYFAVRFPEGVFSTLTQESGITCNLMYGTETLDTAYDFLREPSIVASDNFDGTAATDVFCQFLDNEILHLPPGENLVLTLQIPNISVNLLHQIFLYTTTSNNPNGYIIDSIPLAGSLGQYGNYALSNNNKLAVLNSLNTNILTPSSRPNNIVRPYYTLDTTVAVEIKNYWMPNSDDFIFVFKYNTLAFTPASQVSLESVNNPSGASNPANDFKNSNFGINSFGSDGIILNGINNGQLYPTRTFSLKFSTWKALDTAIGQSTLLRLFVLYRNTYSVVSYSEIAMPKIELINIPETATKINHPEFFDLFDGMAWPLKFTFQVDAPLENASYVVIRQVDTVDASSRWTFVAATCDFGSTLSFGNDFGKRQHCYPLRNDFNYVSESGSASSGIFFKVAPMAAKLDYSLTVWGFAERCGTDSSDVSTSLSTAYRQFKFSINIYGGFNWNEVGAKRLTTNKLIASLNSKQMSQRCYKGHTLPTTSTGLNTFVNLSTNLQYAIVTQEVTQFMTTAITGDYLTNSILLEYEGGNSFVPNGYTNAQLQFDFAGNATITENYFYDSNLANDLEDSYIFIGAIFPTGTAAGGTVTISEVIVSTCLNTTADSGIMTTIRIEMQFSRNWVTSGDYSGSSSGSGCVLSFGYNSDYTQDGENSAGFPNVNSMLLPNISDTAASKQYLVELGTNFVENVTAPNLTDTSINLIDNSRTKLPTSTVTLSNTVENIYKIVSVYNPQFFFGTNAANCDASITTPAMANATQWIELGMFTSCLKWVTARPEVTSLYAYLDFQFKVIYQATSAVDPTNDAPIRVLRYIKLYPEVGIFQSSDNIVTIGATSRFITAHFAHTYGDQQPYAICLLEINGPFLSSSRSLAPQSSSNTLVLWLFATSLLDVDYENPSSEYPAAPLVQGLNVYGLNSGQTISALNRLTSDGTSSYIQSASTTAFNFIELYYFATVGNYRSVLDDGAALNIAGGFTARTFYHMFMGSAIYITGFNSSSNTITADSGTQPNLLIPFLCPQSSTYATQTNPGNRVAFGVPYAMASWMQMSSFSSNIRVNGWLSGSSKSISTFSKSDGSALLTRGSFEDPVNLPILVMPLYRLPLASTFGAYDVKTMNYFNYSTTDFTSTTTRVRHCTIRFKQYSLTSDSDRTILELFAYKLGSTTTTTTNVSSLAMLLNGSMEIRDALSANVKNISNLYPRVMTNGVFVGKQRFTKYIAGTIGVSNTMTNFYTQKFSISTTSPSGNSNSNNFITGIVRPAMNVFLANSAFNYQNFIGISLISAEGNTAGQSFVLTNLIPPSTSYPNGRFTIDIPKKETDGWVITVDNGTTGDNFMNDQGGNLISTLTLPNNLVSVAGNQLKVTFSSGTLSDEFSRCALMNNEMSDLATACTNPSGNVITCNIKKESKEFNICCYNTDTAENWSITNAQIQFTADESVASYINSIPIQNSITSDVFSSPGDYAIATAADGFGTLETINYSHSVPTIGGLGRALFRVNLPRSPVRGSTIRIDTNLSALEVTNVESYCKVRFGPDFVLYGLNPDQGDAHLDSCFASMTSAGITIKLKNMIYKCNISISKSVLVMVWPVLTPQIVDQTSTVEMYLGSSENLINSVPSLTSSTPALTFTKPAGINFAADSLCSVSTVFPSVVDEYSYMKFNIDVKSSVNELEGYSINEVSIFFPRNEFGDHFPNPYCYYSGLQISCAFDGYGILNVRFNGQVSIDQSQYIEIIVAGMRNPRIAQNNTVRFACSVNQSDFIAGTRKNLVIGTGILSPISYLSGATISNLRIHNTLTYQKSSKLPDQISTEAGQGQSIEGDPLGPRDNPSIKDPTRSSLHQFQFSFDTSNFLVNLQSSNLIISNTPFIVVTFPEEYRLPWYERSISCRLSIVESKTDNIRELTEVVKTPSEVTSIGNQVKITFSDESWTFTRNFRYFVLKCYNIPPPVESTVNSTLNSQTTGRFSILVANSDYSSVFRVFTNLNTQAKQLRTIVPDIYLSMSRGLKYEFDNLRWVLDVVGTNGIFNVLYMNTGRYERFSFKFRSNNRVLTGAEADVQLTDSRFRLERESYKVATYLGESIPFSIGCACSENPGYYLVRPNYDPVVFTEVDIPLFVPLAPVQVYLTRVKGTITLPGSYSVRRSGSLYLYFTLSIATFNDLTLSFESGSTSSIDTLVIPAGKSVGRTVFRMLQDTNEGTNISYNLVNIADSPAVNCWVFDPDTLTFQTNGIISTIPNSAILQADFMYYTALDADITLNANSILFRFSSISDITYIYMYCALVCINNEFPSLVDLREGNFEDNETFATHITFITQYTKTDPYDIIFKGLIRNQPYKLIIYIESAEGNTELRTSSNVIFLNFTYPDTALTVDIKTKDPQPIRCLYYRFQSYPGAQVLLPLSTYCQFIFSNTGWTANGCVTCIDQFGFKAPGLPIPNNICSDTQIQFTNETTVIRNQTQPNSTYVYQLCPVPDPKCETEPVNYNENINTISSATSSNDTFLLQTHDVAVVPSFNSTTNTDEIFPENPNVEVTSEGNFVIIHAVAPFLPEGSDTSTQRVLRCFIRVYTANFPASAPTVEDIRLCNDPTSCISELIDTWGNQIAIPVTSSTNINIEVWGVCYNAVPFAENYAPVSRFFSGSINNGNVSPGTNTTGNNNGTNGNGSQNNGSTSSAGRLSLWFGLLLIAIGLIF